MVQHQLTKFSILPSDTFVQSEMASARRHPNFHAWDNSYSGKRKCHFSATRKERTEATSTCTSSWRRRPKNAFSSSVQTRRECSMLHLSLCLISTGAATSRVWRCSGEQIVFLIRDLDWNGCWQRDDWKMCNRPQFHFLSFSAALSFSWPFSRRVQNSGFFALFWKNQGGLRFLGGFRRAAAASANRNAPPVVGARKFRPMASLRGMGCPRGESSSKWLPVETISTGFDT